MNLKDIIKRPIITEKSNPAADKISRYSFEVDLFADKPEIKKAVEKAFGVTVKKIQTVIVKGRTKRMLRSKKEIHLKNWKKATVKLAEGEKIPVFETGE